MPADVQYKADRHNSGLTAAYNYALTIAVEEGFDWLLTLDQDTTLPTDFASDLCEAARFVFSLDTVGAIVPCIHGDGRVISPSIPAKHWAVTRRVPDSFIGIPLEKVYAVNSASTIRVSALKTIGGYDTRFFSDFSDLAMFHRLQLNHFQVFVAGDIRVEHELSVFDLISRTTPDRYESILRAEEVFFDEYLGRIEGIVLLLRLFYRLVYKLWRMGAAVSYIRIALRFLARRLFYSRKHRMESWKQLTRIRSVA
jgi:GT2 family glycosyltransferase